MFLFCLVAHFSHHAYVVGNNILKTMLLPDFIQMSHKYCLILMNSINFVYFVMILCKMPYYISAYQARLAHFCFLYSSGKYLPFIFDVDTNPYAIYEHVLVSAR